MLSLKKKHRGHLVDDEAARANVVAQRQPQEFVPILDKIAYVLPGDLEDVHSAPPQHAVEIKRWPRVSLDADVLAY